MPVQFDARYALASPTGATLDLYLTEADKPRGIVQINHGLAEHAARYARFSRFLADHGFTTYAHDHRGHGHTAAPDAPPRAFAARDGAEKVLADVKAVHEHIAGRHPDLPVIIFGHSMGGLIALNYVLRSPHDLAGAAIWNANFTAGLPLRALQAMLMVERFRLGSDVPSHKAPQLTFQAWAKKVPNRRTEFDWLSRDEAEVDAYIADPLCGWDASVGLWLDLLGFVFHGADDANFRDVPRDLPFNLVGGEKDPATVGGKAVTALAMRMRRMGFSNLETTIYAETRHESLNEINREEVMADFAAWAKEVTG